MHKKSLALIALLASLGSVAASASDLEVSNAWVRGTVPGQKATGAFMDLKSVEGAALVGAASNAGVTQVHEMTMDGGVMRMREAKKLDLPAGQTVSLKPGGYHIMLMDLKKPLAKGEIVPLTLNIQGKDGKTTEVQVKAEVRELNAMPMEHKH
ncbi:MAG: copper chaperone PCu(A)C [Rhodocyclaceae bacterium]|nr:copper chaperone PCu(A)C [Rhodocyclaceae bacterium]